MNTTGDVFDNLRPLLADSLEVLGVGIASQVVGARARVEVFSTPIYALVAILSFVRSDDPETEVAAVSVERRVDAVGGWAIDATGRSSRWLAEYVAGPDGDPDIDMGDAAAVLAGIEAIIRPWADVIVAELKS